MLTPQAKELLELVISSPRSWNENVDALKSVKYNANKNETIIEWISIIFEQMLRSNS